MHDHAEPESADAAPAAAGGGGRVPGAVAAGELTATNVLALQSSAGNRVARKVLMGRRLLQRAPRRSPSDTVWGYVDDDDWARAAWALGQLPEADIRERIEDMTARERRYVVSGSRHSEPAAWVDTIVTVMMDVDKRSAIIGSLHWARWKHEWKRAFNWFHGLSIEDGRAVAKELGYGADELAQVIGDSEYLKKMFPGIQPGHFEMWWPNMSGGAGASTEEQTTLRALVTARNALPIRPELVSKVPYAGVPNAGYQYAAVGHGTVPATASRLPRLALTEFYMLEGGVSAVVTYDRTLSLGPGFADVLALAWVRDWFNHDPAAERAFEAAGMSVSPAGTGWIVVDDSDPPKVLRGEDARQFIRNSPRLLSLYVNLTESADHSAQASDAQIRGVNRKIGEIPADLRTEMESWTDDGVVAAALHTMWWLPAGGPSGSPGRFRGTAGDAYAVARAFAIGLATTRLDSLWLQGPRPTSARVLGVTSQTAGIITHYYDRFGAGGGNRGVLRRAVEANATAITTSANAAMANPALDDHVLLVAAGDTGNPTGMDDSVRMFDIGRWRPPQASTSGAAAAPANTAARATAATRLLRQALTPARGGRLLQREETVQAERNVDAKFAINTGSVDDSLATTLVGLPSIALAIYQDYDTAKPSDPEYTQNDTEFKAAADDFAATYGTLGLVPWQSSNTLKQGVAIAVRSRDEVEQVVLSIHQTLHALAYNKKAAAGPVPGYVGEPKIGTIAIFAHGMPTSLGLDPRGEKGGHWMGQGQIKPFAAAIKPHVTSNVRILLFACNTGIGPNDPALGMPDPDGTGGQGSFAAQLADALGDDTTVYAHNTYAHAESNPFASYFKAGARGREEMFNRLYDKSFVASEMERIKKDKADLVSGIPDDKLAAGLRKLMWSHYRMLVEEQRKWDFTKPYEERDANRRMRHIGGYGGIGAAMFMDETGTGAKMRADFQAWLTDDRVKSLR